MTPERSSIARRTTTAFARKQRGDGDKDDPGDEPPAKPAEGKPAEAKPAEAAAKPADAAAKPAGAAAKPTDRAANPADAPAKPAEAAVKPAEAAVKPADAPAKPGEATAKPAEAAPPEISPPPRGAEPWPDATPEPMPPVETVRARTETAAMSPEAPFGGPPEMPKTSAPPPLALGDIERPTHMPGPREIPGGRPEDPAPAPGTVPPGDSRSLRREPLFALIYRVGTYVITRFGTVGTRGQWRVVEYPTSAAASHAYAKECSRFVSEGFSDYRD